MVEHVKDARRDFLAHFFKRGVRAGRVQLLDDVCDGVADAGNLLKAVLRDDGLKRNAERKQIVGRARIGFGAERVAAAQGAALSELAQQGGDGGCVEGVISLTWSETPGRHSQILRSAAARLSARAISLAPRPQQRPVLAVNRVFARPRGLRDGDQRLLAVFKRGAFVVGARGRVGSDHEEVVARFEALVARACRKDRHIARFQDERASL